MPPSDFFSRTATSLASLSDNCLVMIFMLSFFIVHLSLGKTNRIGLPLIPSLHFVDSALAIENMTRLSDAFVFAPLGFVAAADIHANLIATESLLFEHLDRLFRRLGHCQAPLS